MSSLPTDYKELTRTILQQAADEGRPASGTFELTSRCNLNCAMCYIRTPAGDRAMKASELSAAEWVAMGRQAVDAGMLFLLLTGGEVFLRPDFFEIYEPLTEMGLSLTLFTNATLVTPQIAKRLASRPPNRTEVTIYGASAETYGALTGHPGGYDRCMRGIEALLSEGIGLKVKTTLTKANLHDFDAIQAMAEKWGVPFGASWLLTKRRDLCSNSIQRLRFSPKEAVDVEALDTKAVEKMKTLFAREKHVSSPEAFYCHAGKSSFVIGPSGDMNLCIDLPLPQARPTEIGFTAAWENVKTFMASVPPSHDCSTCELSPYCPRCPAWGYLEGGSLTSSVVYLCEIASERKRRYGPKVPA